MVTSIQFILSYSMFFSFFIFMLQSASVGQYGILTPDATNAMTNMQVKFVPIRNSTNSSSITAVNSTYTTSDFIWDVLWSAIAGGAWTTNPTIDAVYNFFATIYNFFVFVYNGLVILYILFTFNSTVGWITLLIFTPMAITLVYLIIKTLPFMGGGS